MGFGQPAKGLVGCNLVRLADMNTPGVENERQLEQRVLTRCVLDQWPEIFANSIFIQIVEQVDKWIP